MKSLVLIGLALALATVTAIAGCGQKETYVIGSKQHTESHILGELLAQTLETAGYTVDRKFNLGGTKIVFNALEQGDIHAYAEYSGTIQEVILKETKTLTLDEITNALAELGIQTLEPLGFNNSYAMGIHEDLAAETGLSKVSELRDYPDLRFFFSHEFLEREDGYPSMKAHYGLPQSADGIEHALALRAIVAREIDVTDLYTTDAEIDHFNLVVLEDDLEFFPKYLAVPIVRSDLPEEVKQLLNVAAHTLSDKTMAGLNYKVHIDEQPVADVAKEFLATLNIQSTYVTETLFDKLVERTVEHLYLAGIALLAATVVALSISIAVYSIAWLSKPIAYIAGLLQTIPSLALLALMVPLFGIGTLPAIVALFLYSLLPIIRTTVTALSTVDPVLLQVAEGLGYTRTQSLIHVKLPLSMPAIFAGIRISAIICIGTATLAAFIGGGGLGDLIFQGLQLDDTRLILIGAASAALMAIIVELLFEGVEKLIIPGHIAAANRISNDPVVA